jgi:hypothetical protein
VQARASPVPTRYVVDFTCLFFPSTHPPRSLSIHTLFLSPPSGALDQASHLSKTRWSSGINQQTHVHTHTHTPTHRHTHTHTHSRSRARALALALSERDKSRNVGALIDITANRGEMVGQRSDPPSTSAQVYKLTDKCVCVCVCVCVCLCVWLCVYGWSAHQGLSGMVRGSDVPHWTKSAGSTPPRMFCLLSRATNVRARAYEHGHVCARVRRNIFS